MNPETWPELSEWELNSWALLTVPDSSMGHENLASQTQTFPQGTNFYDTSLVLSNSNFQENDTNSSISATNSNLRPSPQQSITSSSQPPQQQQQSRSKSSTTHASPSSSASPTSPNSKVHKRTLNTLAARRYRQKRVDQMSELEQKLKESEKEKEELQMRVARLEGEVEVLRGLLRPNS